jgi:hypothetical protein
MSFLLELWWDDSRKYSPRNNVIPESRTPFSRAEKPSGFALRRLMRHIILWLGSCLDPVSFANALKTHQLFGIVAKTVPPLKKTNLPMCPAANLGRSLKVFRWRTGPPQNDRAPRIIPNRLQPEQGCSAAGGDSL